MENGGPKSRTRPELLQEIATSRARKKEEENAVHAHAVNGTIGTRLKRAEFKAKHGILIAFLTLVLIIHIIGIYLFTTGFLLTRLVLERKSECVVPPVPLHSSYIPGSAEGCWHPRMFNKAVILIIDALRYDFTIPLSATNDGRHARHYHDGIQVLYETAVSSPSNAFLLPFIADPPTTTLQRLKGLTTGTLPTFIDAGSSFAGTAIDEDNLISQLLTAGKNVVHLGDDTWHSLFPGYFDANLTKAYDSFNVWDLHTVDNGVIEHLMPLLHPTNASKWDVLFGHFLGVDHAGHRYGPDHSAMKSKLQQMDEVLRDTMQALDDQTLLVVMGDHGMDGKGDHGGESDDEVEAALWMYSKAGNFGRGSVGSKLPPPDAKTRPVNQIDLVPTLALLLGLPVPFNNLGSPIEEAFIGFRGDAWENLAAVQRLTAAQIHRYQHEYALARKPDPLTLARPTNLWTHATHSWQQLTVKAKASAEQWQDLAKSFSQYQQANLQMCKDLWARFDLVSMAQGITVLTWALILLITYGNLTGITVKLNAVLFTRGLLSLIVGGLCGILPALLMPQVGRLRNSLFFAAIACCGSITYTFLFIRETLSFPIPASLWSWTCTLTTLLLSIGFASNSFTIFEDEILLHFLTTFGLLLFAASFRLRSLSDRRHALVQSLIYITCIRIASLARLCREEQMPYCRSTYYASANSSTSAPWQLAIPYIIATALPSVIKLYYSRTLSWHGSAPFWIGIAFRGTLLLIAVFWTLDAADNGNWFKMEGDFLKTVRTYLAQLVLAIAAGAGGATFGWQAPHIAVQSIEPSSLQSSAQPASPKSPPSKHSKSNGAPTSPTTSTPSQPNAPRMLIHGASNLYGTHFALLSHCVILIPLLLLQKPMGQATLALTSVAILALLETIHQLQRSPLTTPAAATTLSTVLAPTVLALLGHFAFFKTGHQATLASIQWDAAFVPLKTLNYVWGPLFMILNTFAGQIFSAACVPLCVLWRRPYSFTSLHASEGEVSVLGPTPSSPEDGASQADGTDDTPPDARAQARHLLLSDLSKAYVVHILVYATINLATTLWAAHLRRHLMLYRVFMPRWLLGLAGMVTAEVIGIVIGVYGVGWGVASVAGVFGW